MPVRGPAEERAWQWKPSAHIAIVGPGSRSDFEGGPNRCAVRRTFGISWSWMKRRKSRTGRRASAKWNGFVGDDRDAAGKSDRRSRLDS